MAVLPLAIFLWLVRQANAKFFDLEIFVGLLSISDLESNISKLFPEVLQSSAAQGVYSKEEKKIQSDCRSFLEYMDAIFNQITQLAEFMPLDLTLDLNYDFLKSEMSSLGCCLALLESEVWRIKNYRNEILNKSINAKY